MSKPAKSNQTNIRLSMPPRAVVQLLRKARKEMAPRIRGFNSADDGSWFVCTIDYGLAYSVLTGHARDNNQATDLSINTHSASTWPILLTGVVLVGLNMVYDIFIDHPTTVWEWCILPGGLVVWVAIHLMLVPFSKQMLTRFVTGLFEDPASAQVDFSPPQQQPVR